ncbi:hypothetical protein, partial [Acaryochloris sp. IP29b_bin.148]|uniref:hypothetical protein n=1 Tax=Acaryochloris sp. IP29b_bin.148 TaxID=2969218 RepID=UPI002626E9B3
EALSILKENKELLETISEQLLESEVIEGASLRDLLAKVHPEEHIQPEHHVQEPQEPLAV